MRSARAARSAPGTVAGPILAMVTVASVLGGCGAIQDNTRPTCRYGSPIVLMAQSVPGAAFIPCVRSLPLGWHFGGFAAGQARSDFWLDSEVAGRGALDVVLTASCRRGPARAARSDEPGLGLFRRPITAPPHFAEDWYYVFSGGCVTYRMRFPGTDRQDLQRQIERGLSFMRRTRIATLYRDQTGEDLDPVRAGS